MSEEISKYEFEDTSLSKMSESDQEIEEYSKDEEINPISDLNTENIQQKDNINETENISDHAEEVIEEETELTKLEETSVRRLSLFDNISTSSPEKTLDESEKTEPVIFENPIEIENTENIETSEQNEESETEFNASSDELDDEFNQETEEELLDIPTFLRRQAN